MIDVMAERAESIRIEPPGIEGEGVEFRLKRKARLEYHQVKRQQGPRGRWTLRDMREVLSHFYNKLADPAAWCVFVSSQSANELSELAERARSSASWDEFDREFLKAKEQNENFSQLRNLWGLCSEGEAHERLRRIEVRVIDEITLSETVQTRLTPLVEGEPAAVSDVLAQLALENVHHELTAHDIWHHLRKRGLRRREWGKDPHVLAAVEHANRRYLTSIRREAIAGEVIPREEAASARMSSWLARAGAVCCSPARPGLGKAA